MTYNEWVSELKNNLLSCSEGERSRVLAYYAEAYADRREAGFSEREIIEEFGAPYDAAQRILCEADDYYDVQHGSHIDNEGDAEPKHAIQKGIKENSTGKSAEVQKGQNKSGKKHVWLAIVLPIVAIIVVVSLVGVMVGLAFGRVGVFAQIDWESKTYECQSTIDSIDLDFAAGDFVVEWYDGDVIKVDYSHSSRFTTMFSVAGTKLTIATSNIGWNNVFLWFNKIPTTTLYIPRDLVVNLDMEINAGQVTIPDGSFNNVRIELNAGVINFGDVTCNNCTIEVNAGALSMARLSCAKFNSDVSAGSLVVLGLTCDAISVEVSAGSADLTVFGNKEDYTIRTDVSAGSCNVRSQAGKDASKRITVEVSAGSANIYFQNPTSQNA